MSSPSVNINEELDALTKEYRRVNEVFAAAKMKVDDIKRKITAASGGKDVLANGVKVSHFRKKGSIKYKNIPYVSKMIASGAVEDFRGPAQSQTKITIVG